MGTEEAKREYKPKISVEVDRKTKEAYTRHWKSKGYRYESEYTWHLIRKDMRENKEEK